MNNRALRARVLRERRAITLEAARRAGADASRNAWSLQVMRRARRIALYFPVGSELDCEALADEARSRGREIYLPVLQRKQLYFRRFTDGCALRQNRYGIPEPADGRILRGGQLDVVIAPLVAVDSSGCRLGTGGGFYDRTFRFLRYRGCWRRPCFIGFGYELQRVPAMIRQSWDVPLDYAVTEAATYEFIRK